MECTNLHYLCSTDVWNNSSCASAQESRDFRPLAAEDSRHSCQLYLPGGSQADAIPLETRSDTLPANKIDR